MQRSYLLGNVAGSEGTKMVLQALGAKVIEFNVWEHRQLIRDLDVEKFTEILKQVGGGLPTSRHATLAIMHKIRVRYRKDFTEGQQRLSRRWLKAHGFKPGRLNDERLEEVQREDAEDGARSGEGSASEAVKAAGELARLLRL